MTTVSICATRANSSPGAFSMLDITAAISARSEPAAIASPIACKFDPRPEIRMARHGSLAIESGVDNLPVAANDFTDHHCRLIAAAEILDDDLGQRWCADQDETDAHVEGAQHFLFRNV